MKLPDEKSRERHPPVHPYLSGNFAPVSRALPLTPCSYTGSIPDELVGGQYVRNGGNPVTNQDLGRDAHWFDGDGMLSGVAFRRPDDENHAIVPEFVNQFILTDVLIAAKTNNLRRPILPSLSTLVNPLSFIITIIFSVLRTIILVFLSHLPGSLQTIKRISVANTGIFYHDGRALATCESGLPMRVTLPKLETVGWFDGRRAEGEQETGQSEPGLGGESFDSFFREWTTAHPRHDPVTDELLLFHSIFLPPYVNYSILPNTAKSISDTPFMLNAPVPGVSSPKMMHDFAASFKHTVILDLPLSLDPLNLARNKPVVSYDPTAKSRFGVFPRRQPEEVRWFETSAACCIFHTANAWDEGVSSGSMAVNMLACRLTSDTLVYSAGNIPTPTPTLSAKDSEQCRLYFYQFDLSSPSTANNITHQWALSVIPFEFPSLREDVSMSYARYIYGCSISNSTFGAALGRAVKIDCLVKMDVHTLISRGRASPPTEITGCVDTRSVAEILAAERDPLDPIQIFHLPAGWYAQESRFVARRDGKSEDDGWLLSYVFDESQLDEFGEASFDAVSELWIIDARTMKDVVARIKLPQRVPYGLHGNWFDEKSVLNQRPVERLRRLPSDEEVRALREDGGMMWDLWMTVRDGILDVVG